MRSALGIGEKNQDFRASALSDGVVAMLKGVTRMGIVGGVGGEWFQSLAHFASGQIPVLPLASSATACFYCEALAFLMAVS